MLETRLDVGQLQVDYDVLVTCAFVLNVWPWSSLRLLCVDVLARCTFVLSLWPWSSMPG